MKLECSYCSSVSECSCPDSEAAKYAKYPNAKFACPVCSELLEDGVPETELKDSPRRGEVAVRLETEEVCSVLAGMVSTDTFEKGWRERKDFLRPLSKKELAQEGYYEGLRMAFLFFLTSKREGTLDGLLEELKKDRHPH